MQPLIESTETKDSKDNNSVLIESTSNESASKFVYQKDKLRRTGTFNAGDIRPKLSERERTISTPMVKDEFLEVPSPAPAENQRKGQRRASQITPTNTV